MCHDSVTTYKNVLCCAMLCYAMLCLWGRDHRRPRGASRLAGLLEAQRPPVLPPPADRPQLPQPMLRLRAARRHAPRSDTPPGGWVRSRYASSSLIRVG